MYIHIGTEDKVRKGADMAHGQAGGEVGPADRKNEVRHYLDRDINTVQYDLLLPRVSQIDVYVSDHFAGFLYIRAREF